MAKKIQFSITYWIRAEKNPGWNSEDAEIRFPPFTVEKGIKVYTVKQGNFYKIYILHPEYGYRKIAANIKEHIGRDTFVAITVDDTETKLYFNAHLASSSSTDKMVDELEIGDFVMVNVRSGDLKKFNMGRELEVVMPAEVKGIDGNLLELYFFELKEIVKLPRERIVY